jgi:hypothetical protein
MSTNIKSKTRSGTPLRRAIQRRNVRDKIPRNVTTFSSAEGPIIGFPNKIYTHLKYVGVYQIVSTSGAIATQRMLLNSTFDPDSTGGGHQPLYRDTYAALYDQYAVVSTDVKATFVSNASTSSMNVGIVVDDDTSASSSGTTRMEQNNSMHHLLPSSGGSLSTHTFQYHWDCKKILSIDPFASETYKTAVGSDPTEGSYLVCWAEPADLSSTTTTTLVVELVQHVLFTELSTPTGS